MEPIRLDWRRFESFLPAREMFRDQPCVYLQTDPDEAVQRIGESEDLWNRYLGGTAYAVEAAMHGSGNLFFVALAPADPIERKALEATLIFDLQPRYNNQNKDSPPARRVEYAHKGEAPQTLKVNRAV